MPSRRTPNSVPSILRVLQTAHDQYTKTPVVADRAISAEQFALLDLTPTLNPPSFFANLLTQISEADAALALQSPLTTDLARKAARLSMFVSHFHQALDHGIARGFFAIGARAYYGRELTATAGPALGSYVAIAEAAQKIADGEKARALAEGAAFHPMALPSAAEVAVESAAFAAAQATAKTAKEKTDDENEHVTALYDEAQALAEDLYDTVEYFYRKDKVPGSFRTKCRRWGVVYVFAPGETPDPEPVAPVLVPPPAPGPTPTTPA